MKADQNGTRAEQVRATMGWKSPAELRGRTFPGACAQCKYFFLKEIQNRDGGVGNCSPYCGHLMTPGKVGHPTREQARCNFWERKL